MKRYKVYFATTAINDVKDAKARYNRQQKGLGKKFHDDIKRVVSSIALNPYFASEKYEGVRKAVCKKFPYALHYEINEIDNSVSVLAVYHTSREPLI